ncbi:MAG TPA: thioredoxin domain-containing protein [Solirubrobacteraceae bacterium]|jgi:protein-disulfide isomerase
MPFTPVADARAQHLRRIYQLSALLLSTLAIAGVTIAVLTSGSTSQLAPGKPVPGSRQTETLLAGIPQRGPALGNPHAPVTLVELGDLQCPSCALFARDALPALITRYVRPGRVLMIFRALTSIGGDSLRAARMAAALGEQNHLWQFVEEMYRNQGLENSSYVTDTYLRALATAIPGVDVARALAQRDSSGVREELAQAQGLARRLRVKGTPAFSLFPAGSPPRSFSPAGLDSESFAKPLERMLAGPGA